MQSSIVGEQGAITQVEKAAKEVIDNNQGNADWVIESKAGELTLKFANEEYYNNISLDPEMVPYIERMKGDYCRSCKGGNGQNRIEIVKVNT